VGAAFWVAVQLAWTQPLTITGQCGSQSGIPSQSLAWPLDRRSRRWSGLPEWATPKAMRRYYASTLIRGGASIKVVQARLAHKSAKTTLGTYGHLGDEDDHTRRP